MASLSACCIVISLQIMMAMVCTMPFGGNESQACRLVELTALTTRQRLWTCPRLSPCKGFAVFSLCTRACPQAVARASRFIGSDKRILSQLDGIGKPPCEHGGFDNGFFHRRADLSVNLAVNLVAHVVHFHLDAKGNPPQQGEHQSADAVNAESHGNFLGAGHVGREGFKHVGRETGHQQAKTLVDP